MYVKNVPQDSVFKQQISSRNDEVFNDDSVYCPMCEVMHENNTNCQRVD